VVGGTGVWAAAGAGENDAAARTRRQNKGDLFMVFEPLFHGKVALPASEFWPGLAMGSAPGLNTGVKKVDFRWVVFLGMVLATVFMFRTCMGTVERTAREVARTPVEMTRTVAGFFRDVMGGLQPRTEVNERVIYNQSSPVAEFAVRKRQFDLDYTWKHRWLGSTKEIRIRGVYVAKAGFDLTEPFRIRYDEESGTVRAEMPPAKILSVEREGEIDYDDNEGWWNKLTDGERKQALNEFDKQARRRAQESGLLDEAEKEVISRLEELARRNGTRAVFRIVTPSG
jgi:hypothetical protein